jgi:hypothetical protein
MKEEELIHKELLAEVESIAPVVAEHAGASEALGRLDESAMAALRSTRLLQFATPRELGGLGANDPVTQLLVFEAMARIDASTSWTWGFSPVQAHWLGRTCRPLRQRGSSPRPFRPWLVRSCPRALPNGFQVAIESTGAGPMGVASIMPNGCSLEPLLQGNPSRRGAPRSPTPRTDCDSRQLACGRIESLRELRFQHLRPVRSGGYDRLFYGPFQGSGSNRRRGFKARHAGDCRFISRGIALGIARRALDEIKVQATEKGRGFPPSALPTQPHVQFALGKAEIELASARAYGLQVLADLREEAQTGHLPPPPLQAEVRAAGS